MACDRHADPNDRAERRGRLLYGEDLRRRSHALSATKRSALRSKPTRERVGTGDGRTARGQVKSRIPRGSCDHETEGRVTVLVDSKSGVVSTTSLIAVAQDSNNNGVFETVKAMTLATYLAEYTHDTVQSMVDLGVTQEDILGD